MFRYMLFVIVSLAFGECRDLSQPKEGKAPVVPFLLPAPSGNWGIGRYWCSLTDSSRAKKEVSLFVYYLYKER